MPNYTQAKLDNGETVNVVIPPGMTEEQAGVAFMRNYNANKAAFHPPANPAAPPTQANAQQQNAGPSTGVMNPNQPGVWDTLKDVARKLAGTPADVASNLSYTLGSIPAMPKALYDKMTLGQPSPELRDWDKIVRQGAAEWQSAGAGYEPKTAAGDIAGQIGSGVVGAALSRLGIPTKTDLALGATSGGLGYAGQKLGGESGLGDLAGLAGSAAPFVGAAGLNALSPASKIYATARGDIARTQPQQIARAQALENSATANDIPSMAWQHFSPDTAMFKRGAAVAGAPPPYRAEDVQANLSALQGGGPTPEHASADFLDTAGSVLRPSNVQGNPVDAQALAKALRKTDALRNADIGVGEMTSAPGHETGDIALGMHVLKEALPEAGLPGIGAMSFAKVGALKNLMAGPTRDAMDTLYSAPTWDQFKQLAQTDPKGTMLRQMLQAYLVPSGLGMGPTPVGVASMSNPGSQ